METIVREPGYDGGDCVFISWCKNLTIWEADPTLYQKMMDLRRSCWPTKTIAHTCCCPFILVRALNPFIWLMMDKEMRSRALMHNVPEREIVSTLATFWHYERYATDGNGRNC